MPKLLANILWRTIRENFLLWTGTAIGFTILYYFMVLLFTMIRFGEIPNYLHVYNVFHVYAQILHNTPSLSDALGIMKDEAWLETGFKDPEYFGIATWSYMLIPPKMIIVFLVGLTVSTLITLSLYSRKISCPIKNKRGVYAMAGVGTGLVSLTSVTLSWVACCSTPTWVVGLTMLGMSSALSQLFLPYGTLLTTLGIGLLLWVVYLQLKRIASKSVAAAS